MKLKRVLSFIAVLLLALTIVACKKTEDDPAEEILDRAVEVLNNVIDKPEEIKTSFGVPSTMVDGVTVTWASSEPGVVTFGEVGDRGIITAAVSRPSFEDGDQKVTITATLTVKSGLSDDNITRKWEKELTVIAFDPVVGSYSSFTDAYNDVENGTLPLTSHRTDILIFDNVSYHGKTSGGFFFATQDGALGYAHGTANLPQAGVKGELKAKVYNYFGFLQLDDYEFVPEDGTTADYEVDYVEMTNDDINKLPLLGSPFPDNMSGPSTYKLKNVMLYVDESIDQSRYNLVILPFGYDFDNAERNEAGDLHYEDSILVYYTNLEFDQMKLLSGLEISELDVIYEGYRDDRHVKYVTILGLDNIKLAQELTDENKVAMVKTALSVETDFPVAGDIDLPTTGTQGSTIKWDYVDETNTNNSLVDLETGKVTIPAEGRVSVKIVATITVGQVEDTKEFEIKVGSYVLETISDALAADDGDVLMVSGVVTDRFANETYGFQDGTGSIAIYTPTNLVLGQEYTLIGEKDTFNGLHQFTNIEIEGTPTTATMPTAFAIDAILGDKVELAKHIAGLVSIEGAEVIEVGEPNSHGNVSVKIKKGDVVLEVRYDSRVDDKASTTVLTALKVGDIVNYVGNLGWYNNPQLGYGPNTHLGEGWPGGLEPGEPGEPGEEVEIVFDFSTLTNDTTYYTVATTFDVNDIEFERINANISASSDHKGVVLGIRSGSDNANNWQTPYLRTNELLKATKIEFTVTNWNNDANYNLSYADHIYIQTSTDGTTWTNSKDFKTDWDTAAYANNVLVLDELDGTPVFIRLIAESAGTQSEYQLRLIVKGMKVWATK